MYYRTETAQEREARERAERKEAKETAEREQRELIARLRADAEAKHAEREAGRAAAVAADAERRRVAAEAALQDRYRRFWTGSASEFDAWWQSGGRIQAMGEAAEAAQRDAAALAAAQYREF